MSKRSKKYLLGLILMGMLVVGSICFAQTPPKKILPDEHGTTPCPSGSTGSNCGNYSVNDFVQIAVNVAQFIWGISGGLALLFFIYGGFMYIISSGSSDKVNQATTIIKNSLIGLVIIFASWTIINFVFNMLGVTANGGWNVIGWFQPTN